MIPREILEKVRLIEIRARRLVDDVFSGQYQSVFKGRGMEFEEVREYAPGDDIRAIDWNVTARMGQLFVKKYREERELTVMLVVDVSGSLEFGSEEKLKSDVAAELCAILAFSAIRNNDRVGLLTFSDKVLNYIPPKKGRRHGMRVIRDILYPQTGEDGAELETVAVKRESISDSIRLLPDRLKNVLGLAFKTQQFEVKTKLSESLSFLNRVLRRRSIVFLVSDFISSDDFVWDLMLTSKRHDLTACVISDAREKELAPAGLLALEDAETGQKAVIDTNNDWYRRWFAEHRRKEAFELSQNLLTSKVECVWIPTAGDYLAPLVSLFQRRRKRLALGR